jgi:hypothetical protein
MTHVVLTNATTGDIMSPKDFQRSVCSEQFDEYVFQALDPFSWSLVGAASREVKNLWNGRRLKIHYNGTWREGKVCGWKQYNPCSSCHMTKWNLELELDTWQVNDVVDVTISGTICTVDNNNGALCAIKVPQNEGQIRYYNQAQCLNDLSHEDGGKSNECPRRWFMPH